MLREKLLGLLALDKISRREDSRRGEVKSGEGADVYRHGERAHLWYRRQNEWNNKAVEITGFTRDDVLGQDLVQGFITKEFRESVKEVLDDALSGKEAANFEFPLFTKRDKRRVDVLLNATTRRDAAGNAVGVIGVGQDITARKQIEEEMTRVAKELQTFIDTANADLRHRREGS